MRTLILKNSEWARGGGASYLHGAEGYCCLGIACRDFHGVEAKELHAISYPYSLAHSDTEIKIEDLGDHELQWLIANINDATDIDTDDERITLLQEQFSKIGITLDYREDE